MNDATKPRLRRPADLVDERVRLAAAWRPGGFMHAIVASGHALVVGDRDHYAWFEHDTVSKASLWWVTSDMCELVEAAMRTVPSDTTLDPDLVGDQHVLCFLETPLLLTDARTGERNCQVDALVWGTELVVVADGEMRPAVALSSYTWDHGQLMPLGRSDWLVGNRVVDDESAPVPAAAGHGYDESVAEDRRLAVALWLLATQPGIATAEARTPDRAAARRAARAGFARNDVRVVRLRTVEGEPETGRNGAGSVDEGAAGARRVMSVRTIVSGHWRSQPWGPGKAHRRPVWIAPHLRGPHDAPLRVRPVVKLLDTDPP